MTSRTLLPRKFGTAGPVSCSAGCEKFRWSGIALADESARSAPASGRGTGGDKTAIERSFSSALTGEAFSGPSSGRSLGTFRIRKATAATSRNTGADTGPPYPASPRVPCKDTTTTTAGFVTGAKPINEALYSLLYLPVLGSTV